MPETEDPPRIISLGLPPNTFYKFSLPGRIMSPTRRRRHMALVLKQVNSNLHHITTGPSTTKRKAVKEEEREENDPEMTRRVSSRQSAVRAAKLQRMYVDGNEEAKTKVKQEPKEQVLNLAKLQRMSVDGNEEAKIKVKQQPKEQVSSVLSDYEAKRLKNIEENAKFFASLGIFQAKDELKTLVNQNHKAVARVAKRDSTTTVQLPKRAPSLRLLGKKPDGSDIPDFEGYQTTFFEQYQSSEDRIEERCPEGPLDMECTTVKKEIKKEGDLFIEQFVRISANVKEEPRKELGTDAASLLKQLQSLKISEGRVAKVVPNRAFSIGFHPSPDRTIIAVGDKWGNLGFWDLDSSESDDDRVFLFSPHIGCVNCLRFCPTQPSKVFTCSYDGTLRCGDFEKGVFDEIYATKSHDALLHCFDFLDASGSNILVAQNEREGHVVTMDTRSPGSVSHKPVRLHDKVIRTVSVHPVHQQYFVTASTDRHIALWDVRKLNSKGDSVWKLPHYKTVNSAYFSPITGSKILSTCADDMLRIYEFEGTDKAIKDVSLASRRYHNNQTGRWLTKFRAMWHPRCEEIFIVGSMARPRQVELFNDQMELVHTYGPDVWLQSVCSLNAFHPTRDIVAGANSSGRVHVFM